MKLYVIKWQAILFRQTFVTSADTDRCFFYPRSEYRRFSYHGKLRRKVPVIQKSAAAERSLVWELIGKTKEFSYFSHRNCEYFPCHKGADVENFNCLFCYCPLYALGKDCGGNFRMTEKGLKDCSNCLIPHKRENYGYITKRYQELVARMKEFEETR